MSAEGNIRTYAVGDRVKLLANAQEGWPEEAAVVNAVPERAGDPYTVTVDMASRQSGHDDGLREVMPEQMEPSE